MNYLITTTLDDARLRPELRRYPYQYAIIKIRWTREQITLKSL